MKCPECGGTGCMPIQWTLMLDGICDRCGGTGWVDDDDEFYGDMASLPDGWEDSMPEITLEDNIDNEENYDNLHREEMLEDEYDYYGEYYL